MRENLLSSVVGDSEDRSNVYFQLLMCIPAVYKNFVK